MFYKFNYFILHDHSPLFICQLWHYSSSLLFWKNSFPSITEQVDRIRSRRTNSSEYPYQRLISKEAILCLFLIQINQIWRLRSTHCEVSIVTILKDTEYKTLGNFTTTCDVISRDLFIHIQLLLPVFEIIKFSNQFISNFISCVMDKLAK